MVAMISVLGTAVVYGRDVFRAAVLRPALAVVDDRAVVAVTGNARRYGDGRMPIPGVLGAVAAAASAALFAVSGRWLQTLMSLVAFALLLAWLALYVRVSAPNNRQLTAVATTGEVPPNARVLQHKWDRIINARATLQGVAVAALCLTLMI